MAQYPINPIEASKQPNGPISTTPIKVVQIQTLGPRQFSAGRPDPTPQRHASVGCVFRRACATATAPPPTRPCSAMEPPSTAPHRRPSPAVAAMFCREATFHRAAVPHGIILRSRGGGLHSSAVRRCEAVHVRSTRFRPRTEPNYRLTDLSVSTLL